MAVVTVALGQCGNQLGHTLFGSLFGNTDGDDAGRARFFREKSAASSRPGVTHVARSVLQSIAASSSRLFSLFIDRHFLSRIFFVYILYF